MDFEEFNAKAKGLVAKIIEQNPIAIIRFGSSIRYEDYIPGVSDLDMVVVSKERIRETSNDLGFEYFYNHPNKFVKDFVNGNPFIMNAVLNGKVVYDPNGFIESLKELSGKGLVIGPTEDTFHYIIQGIGNQLSSAMNRYFSDKGNEGDKVKLLRNVHSAVRGVGIFYAVASKGELPDGYSALLSKLNSSQPELAKFLKSTREYLVNHHEVSPEKSDRVLIGNDELGRVIQTAENVYISGVPIVNARVRTNELIESYQSQRGRLEQTLAVRLNNVEFNHLILGNRNERNYVFGLVETDSQQPEMIEQEVPKEQLKNAYSKLRILV